MGQASDVGVHGNFVVVVIVVAIFDTAMHDLSGWSEGNRTTGV